MESFIAESKIGAKDKSILIRRKEIAPQIRALLGEYHDPRVNYAKTMQKMQRLILNTKFLEDIRELGLGVFLFERGTQPPTGDFNIPIAGDASDVYSPLNGLLTTKEIAQAVKEQMGEKKLGDVYKWFVAANAIVNYNKVVLNPGSIAKNFQSSGLILLANGHWDLRKMKNAVGLVRANMGIDDGTGGAMNAVRPTQEQRDKQRKYRKELIDLGILDDGATMGDFRTYIDQAGPIASLVEAGIDKIGLGGVIGSKSLARRALATGNEWMQIAFRFGDDFWKVIGYENEKDSLIKAGYSEADAKIEAAERTKNTYPTYSRAGAIIKALGQSPFVGTFATFSAEIIRTSFHNIRYGAMDFKKGMKTGNKPLMLHGLNRLASYAAVSAGIYGLQLASMALKGVDDEDDEAFRLLGPPWMRNSNLLYTGRDENGNLTAYDLSSFDPYGMFKRVLIAIMRDQPIDDALRTGIWDTVAPFFSADILITTITDLIYNKKASTGRPIYDDANKWEKIPEYLLDQVQPGIVGAAERWNRAFKDEKKSMGYSEYREEEEAMAMLGWRSTTIHPPTALSLRAIDLEKTVADSRKLVKKELANPNKVSGDDIRKAFEAGKRVHDEAYDQFAPIISAAKKSGMKQEDIDLAMKKSQNEEQRNYLVRGRTPPFKLTQNSEKDAIENARQRSGRNDFAVTIRERYAIERKLEREAQQRDSKIYLSRGKREQP